MARRDFQADEYDPDEIYAGGSMDTHGHSSNLRCHVPKTWLGPMSSLIASPEWPEYRDTQSIIRDALYHRLHWTTTQKDREAAPGVARAMAIMRFERSREAAEQMMHEAEEMDQGINNTVIELLRAGDNDSATRLLNEFDDTVRQTFPEPHLSRLLETIERLRKRAWR